MGSTGGGSTAGAGGVREADGERPRKHAVRRSSGLSDARAWSRSASSRSAPCASEANEQLARFTESIRRRRFRI